MDYDTSLITGAEIARYSFVQDLANLVADAEITLDNCALEASRWVYKELEASGVDPTAITNQNRLYRAVALKAIAMFQAAGYVVVQNGEPDRFDRLAKEEIHGDPVTRKGGFRAVYSDPQTATPRKASEAVPLVGHLSSDLVFSGDVGVISQDFFSSGPPPSNQTPDA